MWKNLLAAIKQRLTPQGMKRLGWYACLAMLLAILGAASTAYRGRSMLRYDRNESALRQTAEPLTAMSMGTPQPLEALFIMPEPTPEPTPEPVTFTWPVEGEIIGEYAPETLVWSETLNQWQSHPGFDIAAAAGEAVVACADGTVREAWEDPLWGYVIELEHREGYVSGYANLSTLNMVEPGDTVTAGQIIGAVGDTADCESALPWHLHFELTKDGAPVDASKLMD